MIAPPGLSVLDSVGPQAARVEALWSVFWWVSVAVTTLVLGFELVAIARSVARRRRQGDRSPLATDPMQERRIIRVIVGATILTVLTLCVLLVVSVRTGDALAALADDGDPVEVKITGHQWWWAIEYDPTTPNRVTTANELHVPVGRTVKLQLASADVIHSFWVPNVHGKKDLIPGRQNETWIRIDEPGRYIGQCAEFCGLQHARMRIVIVAEPADEFEAWLAAQREPASAPMTDSARRGRDVFTQGTCAMCHTIVGTDAGGAVGPDLTHLASRSRIAAGMLPNTVGHRAGWILDPQHIKPGVRMPPNQLSSADLEALLAYLETLR